MKDQSHNAENKNISLTDEEFKLLRDFIHEKTGIYIDDKRKYFLEIRLSNRIKKLNLSSYKDYYYYLKYDPNRNEELKNLFNVITTNETSFFRNPIQLKIFEKEILPKVIEQKRKSIIKKIRIWSAGCSTGEEPYTIAIIVSEVLGREKKLWNIKIIGNDLSPQVIETAKRGIYMEYTLRNTPKHIIEKYFTQIEKGKYEISSELKKMVYFHTINLIDRSQTNQVEMCDIIFCRNVLIYFDDENKRKVVNNLYDRLVPGGYLFVGHSENLHNITRAFVPCSYPGGFVYQKVVK